MGLKLEMVFSVYGFRVCVDLIKEQAKQVRPEVKETGR